MDSSATDYRVHLRELGLTQEISAVTARRVWGKLIEINSARGTAKYDSPYQYGMFRDAYDAIAEEIVRIDTPDEVIDKVIPQMVERFGNKHRWTTHMTGMTPPAYGDILSPQVGIWRGRKLQMEPNTPLDIPSPSPVPSLSIGRQIEAFRVEANVTQEKLAELVGIDVRNVQRHLAGASEPSKLNLARYEREFTKLLKRQTVISKTP